MTARLLRYCCPALLALAWLGCDAAGPDDDVVRPEIRLTFVEPVVLSEGASKAPGARAALPQATYTVRLTVRNALTGEDFSPDPITVEDSESRATFTLSLTPGAPYAFGVRYSEGATTVAEGGAFWFVDRATGVVEVPIVPLDPTVATVGFLPGRVVTRAGGGSVDLTLRYYGAGAPVVGLACVLGVSGVDAADLDWSGSDLTLASGDRLEAAWRWDTPVTGQVDLATLTLPLDQALDLQLVFQQGNLRVVEPGGAIAALQAVGADIEVNP